MTDEELEYYGFSTIDPTEVNEKYGSIIPHIVKQLKWKFHAVRATVDGITAIEMYTTLQAATKHIANLIWEPKPLITSIEQADKVLALISEYVDKATKTDNK